MGGEDQTKIEGAGLTVQSLPKGQVDRSLKLIPNWA